ncbi:ABC transporter ATP-binding protein [Pseudonocardia sp. H11422]|uniref:ABC transporter ATP-binding protein n=1 Tax=Pseudonocardia sp. H11422 TaxID=2835866 RepID=UPI001BDC4FEA|nr:ABC transporter ATP-binding protein [Pseudonocardia sp. H11422]
MRAPTEVAAEPRISATNLWQLFTDKQGNIVQALADLTTTVGGDEFVSIVGPSGCGKSTLLMILAGLQKPTSGAVTVNGRAVHQTPADVGLVFQRDLLLEWGTALQNVLLPYRLAGENPRPHVDRARQLLAGVGLAGFEGYYPRQLSGGMRQRVAVCRALVREPSILFMDEPFGALDALTREQLNVDLSRLFASDSGKTVVFVTHDIEEAVYLSDRVCVMSAKPGRIRADIAIDLPPRPRALSIKSSIEFQRYVAQIRGELQEQRDHHR